MNTTHETSFDASTQNILDIALSLVEQGKSTVDTAFIDAFRLIERHTIGMINYLSIKDNNVASYDNPNVYDSRVTVQLPTPFSLQPYEAAYNYIKSETYRKLANHPAPSETEAA